MASSIAVNPKRLRAMCRLLEPFVDYHRLTLRGEDHLAPGPALLVSNHSGGGSLGDALFVVAWYRRHGYADPIHVLAHDAFFQVPVIGRLLNEIGVLRACPSSARDALAAGRKVLVFPGSDHDSLRPFHARIERS